ncbi:MAG: GNAT family N-acetyltransferase [Phycisphaerales bacterium]|nr:GNAT family N-acetyltransferase [Phycisphaerales bacterium]
MEVDPGTIRAARRDDAASIRAIVTRVYADYSYVLDTQREDTHLADPVSYFADGGGGAWVAEVGGAVAGSAAVKIHGPDAEIKTVYVAHEFRRRGLARRLTARAIEHARSRGCRVMLWSDTLFHEAHRLYESLGFVRTGRRSVSIVNTFDEYRYELP